MINSNLNKQVIQRSSSSAGGCDDDDETPEIDLEVLAQKIYNLLKNDLTIEQERQGRRQHL